MVIMGGASQNWMNALLNLASTQAGEIAFSIDVTNDIDASSTIRIPGSEEYEQHVTTYGREVLEFHNLPTFQTADGIAQPRFRVVRRELPHPGRPVLELTDGIH